MKTRSEIAEIIKKIDCRDFSRVFEALIVVAGLPNYATYGPGEYQHFDINESGEVIRKAKCLACLDNVSLPDHTQVRIEVCEDNSDKEALVVLVYWIAEDPGVISIQTVRVYKLDQPKQEDFLRKIKTI